MHVYTVPMHSQTLHKPTFYSVYECIGTVYTCMNSWKEAFNPIIVLLDLFLKLSEYEFCTHTLKTSNQNFDWTTIRTLIGWQSELWLDDNWNFDWMTIRTLIGRQSELRLDDNRNFDWTTIRISIGRQSELWLDDNRNFDWTTIGTLIGRQSELWLDYNRNFDWTTIGILIGRFWCMSIKLILKSFMTMRPINGICVYAKHVNLSLF
jgi:hypothetical protein